MYMCVRDCTWASVCRKKGDGGGLMYMCVRDCTWASVHRKKGDGGGLMHVCSSIPASPSRGTTTTGPKVSRASKCKNKEAANETKKTAENTHREVGPVEGAAPGRVPRRAAARGGVQPGACAACLRGCGLTHEMRLILFHCDPHQIDLFHSSVRRCWDNQSSTFDARVVDEDASVCLVGMWGDGGSDRSC